VLLGLILDQRLTGADHIKSNKRILFNSNILNSAWKQSYKTQLTPISAGHLDILQWRMAKNSNIYKVQTFQSINLRKNPSSISQITPLIIPTNLKINSVEETAKVGIPYKRFRSRPTNHPNPLISVLNSETIPGCQRCRELNIYIFILIKINQAECHHGVRLFSRVSCLTYI